MARWIQEGYWGQYFIRLSAEGLLAFQRPIGGGRWRMYVVNLNPADGGGAKLTSIEIYDNAGLVAPGVVEGGTRLPARRRRKPTATCSTPPPLRPRPLPARPATCAPAPRQTRA